MNPVVLADWRGLKAVFRSRIEDRMPHALEELGLEFDPENCVWVCTANRPVESIVVASLVGCTLMEITEYQHAILRAGLSGIR